MQLDTSTLDIEFPILQTVKKHLKRKHRHICIVSFDDKKLKTIRVPKILNRSKAIKNIPLYYNKKSTFEKILNYFNTNYLITFKILYIYMYIYTIIY